MDTINQIAAAIQAEISRLQQALSILTGGAAIKRRGRPRKDSMPDWVTSNGATATPPARKKRTFSPAQRKAAAERMRKMWAEKKKKAAVKKA
jgi:hypothetical protein